MHEYGIGLVEIRQWTFGQILYFLERITRRYKRQNGKAKKKGRSMTDKDLLRSEYLSG